MPAFVRQIAGSLITGPGDFIAGDPIPRAYLGSPPDPRMGSATMGGRMHSIVCAPGKISNSALPLVYFLTFSGIKTEAAMDAARTVAMIERDQPMGTW